MDYFAGLDVSVKDTSVCIDSLIVLDLKWPIREADIKLTRPRAGAREGEAHRSHGMIAAARQQIFWKRARQRGTLTGGST
jgi:hypothetical protein